MPADEIADDEVRHRCGGAAKQLRILRQKVAAVDPQVAGEIEDLEAEIHGLEERLTGDDGAGTLAETPPIPDGGRTMYDYEVGVQAFCHVQVLAEYATEASQKATDEIDLPQGWDVSETYPSRLETDGGGTPFGVTD